MIIKKPLLGLFWYLPICMWSYHPVETWKSDHSTSIYLWIIVSAVSPSMRAGLYCVSALMVIDILDLKTWS